MSPPAAAPAAAKPPARIMPRAPSAPDPRLSALSLLDEAAHRLRAAPAGTLGIYYATTLPFVLAALYVWADMSRSADAAEREVALSLGLAALFVVMKTGQTVFVSRLRASFAGQSTPRWTARRLARAAAVQATWQPTGLFVLPVALVVFLPLGWAYAFYQNLTICGDGEPSTSHPVARAWRHSLARPGQNHQALTVFWGLEFFAWLAFMVAMFTVPTLLKTFTGEDNAITRSNGLALLNSTFLAVSGALVYLTFNPLSKTFYALRCFYTDARTTGEDLLAELRALPSAAAPVALVAVCLFVLPAVARAAVSPAPAPAAARVDGDSRRGVSPTEMDRSVRDVLARREFAWRGPRVEAPADKDDKQPGAIARFFKTVGETVDGWIKTIRRWFDRDDDDSSERQRRANEDGGGMAALGGMLKLLIYALLAACVVMVAWLLFRAWQGRRADRTLSGKELPATSAVPDLTDEAVLADQLPEDEWLALARELLARGERRLALRAFYLSALSSLGGQGLLGIARHKSNRDYVGELRRRARDRGTLQTLFGGLVGRFERVWYGTHPADDALLAAFQDERSRLAAELTPPAPASVPAAA